MNLLSAVAFPWTLHLPHLVLADLWVEVPVVWWIGQSIVSPQGSYRTLVLPWNFWGLHLVLAWRWSRILSMGPRFRLQCLPSPCSKGKLLCWIWENESYQCTSQRSNPKICAERCHRGWHKREVLNRSHLDCLLVWSLLCLHPYLRLHLFGNCRLSDLSWIVYPY